MADVILTDWAITETQRFHYKLESQHRQVLENLFKMQILSSDQLEKNDNVVFYWGNKFRMSLLKNFPQMKWLHLGSSGIDNINVSNLTERNIKLTTSRGLYSDYVAEFLFSLIMVTAKLPIELLFNQEQNNRAYIQRMAAFPYKFEELNILIFGTGVISDCLEMLFEDMNCKVSRVSLSGRKNFLSMDELDKSVKWSHIISLLPLNELNKYFFSHKFFKTYCKGSIFINAGRGETVNYEDLIQAIDNNILRGAVLDTHQIFNGDCKSLPYIEHSKIISTPHIASWSSKFSQIQFNFLKYQVGSPK
jgi:phosphoglycerate dehydrogenase-like enzyme